MRKPRIWEIDALRGLFILLVILAHLYFDLTVFIGDTIRWAPLDYLFQYGGLVFVVLSGVSATLGSRSFRRGLLVFGCGMAITAVFGVLIAAGLILPKMMIWFGVLHLLGVCMMLYPLLKKLPGWALWGLGLCIIVAGYWLMTFRLPATPGLDWTDFLFPLGLLCEDFSAGDHFPLLPYLGWFMLGIALGRKLYRRKQSLLPRVDATRQPLRCLCFIGRHSLETYLIHQPLLYGLMLLISLLR